MKEEAREMGYTIIIMSYSRDEVEWEEKISANTQRGARAKATKWIKANLFECDYSEIIKEQATTKREYWHI